LSIFFYGFYEKLRDFRGQEEKGESLISKPGFLWTTEHYSYATH